MTKGEKQVILDLNTKIKVVEANEEAKLFVKQIVTEFNVCRTQVYEILKKKPELKERKIIWKKYTLVV